MARSLIAMYRVAGCDWHVGALTKEREETKLAFWGLVELDPKVRGLRRVTQHGESWLRGQTRVPKYAYAYDGACLAHAGEEITVKDALGKKFDYDELMSF
jgi:hypothetical protein